MREQYDGDGSQTSASLETTKSLVAERRAFSAGERERYLDELSARRSDDSQSPTWWIELGAIEQVVMEREATP